MVSRENFAVCRIGVVQLVRSRRLLSWKWVQWILVVAVF